MGGGQGSIADFRSKLFMRPLPVRVDTSQDTVITEKITPKLKFYLNLEGLNESSLRCYASGGRECVVTPLEEPGYFTVEAAGEMQARRGKYTLTASDNKGGTWYWYSQLWVRPRR